QRTGSPTGTTIDRVEQTCSCWHVYRLGSVANPTSRLLLQQLTAHREPRPQSKSPLCLPLETERTPPQQYSATVDIRMPLRMEDQEQHRRKEAEPGTRQQLQQQQQQQHPGKASSLPASQDAQPVIIECRKKNSKQE
ncbi:unnamed protein product, partial [Ectocarpus sp. 12 AP-2014]